MSGYLAQKRELNSHGCTIILKNMLFKNLVTFTKNANVYFFHDEQQLLASSAELK